MTEADILYRAFGELFKIVSGENATEKIIDAIAKATEPEFVTVTHNVCHIETDWLTAIERGLVFVGKAIEEDRQFIRSDGEVKPIEKVKHISKESVQHLSRHSDLITREQKSDEGIVPDKLYTVEKDSDYAVYENRFLYMLLCYIRDFVNVRYRAITDAYKEYRGEYTATKSVKISNRKLKFSFNLTDEQGDAMVAPTDEECASALARINIILQSVAFYMRTPLMQAVSTVDKIGPKVTKTNVLLKDKNFYQALQLYEYLLAYEQDGYTIEKRVDKLEISDTIAHELAVPTLLSAFLVYEHGLGLEKYLQEEFEREELRRAEEAQKELQRKLLALKRRIERTGEGIEQYILMLEERNAILENSYTLLQEALAQIEELKANISRLQNEIELLQQEIDSLNAEIRRLQEEMARREEEHKRQIAEMQRLHEEEIASLKAAHAEELAVVKQRAQEQLEQLKKQMDEQIARLNAAHKEELDKLRAAHNSRIEALQADHKRVIDQLRADYEKRLADGATKMQESENKAQNAFDKLAQIQTELRLTVEERDLLGARLTAVRKEHGLLTEADDFTTEEGFTALEHEFEVLCRMLTDEWQKVKAMLRKEMFDSIRATMRKKKPKKSKEYLELQQFVRSREEGAETPDNGDDGNAETADADVDATSTDEAVDGESADSPKQSSVK